MRILLIPAVCLPLFAQAPHFEVASIKPSGATLTRTDFTPAGRLSATGITVRALIQQADGLQSFQITGTGPVEVLLIDRVEKPTEN